MISITYHHHRAIKRERDGGTGGGGKRKACSTRGPRKNGDGRTAPGPRWMPGQAIHICGNEPRQMMAFFARFSFDAGGHGHSHRGRHLARVSVDDDTANPFFNGTGSFCCAFHLIFPQLYLLYKIVSSQKRRLYRARISQLGRHHSPTGLNGETEKIPHPSAYSMTEEGEGISRKAFFPPRRDSL